MRMNGGQLAAAKSAEELALFGVALKALAPGGLWHPDTLWSDNKTDTTNSRYRLVSARELAEPVRPMRWLVRGIWPERSAGVLAGDKKSMKTWNLQALAIAVAAGTALFDRYHVTSRGPVLYLSGEGGRDTFANRHQVIAERYGLTNLLPELAFGAEFGVGKLTDEAFIDVVKCHLDELQPKLVILDPLYAYDPSDVEVQNVYARGPMLTNLRELIGDEAALIVGDHFNKTAGSRLDLDNIAQAGMAQWADSWILQKHRETPNLESNKFWLEVETGTRRGGGKHLEVDWTLERDQGDPDVILWTGVDWESKPATAKSAGGQADDTVAAILQVVADHPFELTETSVLKLVGGNHAKARETFQGLKANGGVIVKNCAANENGRPVNRDRVGPGQNAERLRLNRYRRRTPTAAGVHGRNRYRGRYGFGTGCPMNGGKYLLGGRFQPVPARGTGCPPRRPRRAGYGTEPVPAPAYRYGFGCPPWPGRCLPTTRNHGVNDYLHPNAAPILGWPNRRNRRGHPTRPRRNPRGTPWPPEKRRPGEQ